MNVMKLLETKIKMLFLCYSSVASLYLTVFTIQWLPANAVSHRI